MPGQRGVRGGEQASSEQKTASEIQMMPVYLIGLYVFVLSIFVGYEVISKVPPLLHTPLMSGTNAISGISLV